MNGGRRSGERTLAQTSGRCLLTVSSDGKRSAKPDSRIQWHRYNESPPFTSNVASPIEALGPTSVRTGAQASVLSV